MVIVKHYQQMSLTSLPHVQLLVLPCPGHRAERKREALILHNVPESKATDPQVRKKEDIDFVQSVFSEILNTPATVTNAIRLGKKDSRVRLLKVSVESLDKKSNSSQQIEIKTG